MNPGDLWRALRSLMGKRAVQRDVDEELEAHLAHRVDDLVAMGVRREEARARAEAEFGDVEAIRRECHEERIRGARRKAASHGIGTLGRDLAWAGRQLRRNPGFAAVAVLTLALGLGATTAIVGVVQAVVLEPLPFEAPHRLAILEEVTPAGQDFSVSEATYVDWSELAASFESVGAMTTRGATLLGRGEPRQISAGHATASLLPTLGVRPLVGRGFRVDEDQPGEPARVTVLGHSLWIDVFGGDPDVVGTDVVLDGVAHRVLGVLPPDRSFLDDPDLLVPLGADPTLDRDDHYLDVFGRLAPGVELDAARAEMRALAARLGEIHPEDRGWSTKLTGLRDVLVGDDLTTAGWVLMAAAGLLLLIALVNVSNILLARATTRAGEMGVRVALGAGRARLVRQLFTESLVLVALATGLGLALASLALPVVKALGAGRIPRLEHAGLDPLAILACGAAAVAAVLVFGLAPAAAVRGSSPARAMGRTRGGEEARGRGVRSALVVGQIGLSLALLLGTGLLVRSFVALSSVDTGFDPEGTLTVRLSMPGEAYEPEARIVLVQRILDEVRAVPGVAWAGATATDPFSGNNLMNFVAREDRLPSDARDFLPVSWRVVTPGFVEAMDLDLLQGRGFRRGDDWEGDTPVMVSRTLAEELWGPDGESPVGRALVWGDPDGSRLTVVGVVEDLRDWRLADEPLPTVFRPHAQIPWTVMTVVARSRDGAAGPRSAELRDAVRRAAPGLAIPDVGSLDQNLRRALAGPRFNAALLGVFAVAGLALALVGVYGVTAFGVSRRRREIGIRLALGGRPESIRRMVLAEGMRLALAGILLGCLGGWALARAASSLLYETATGDPVTWTVVPAILTLTTLVAAWIPSWRATDVSPREVLTSE